MMISMLALLPEDEVPGSLFLGLFLEDKEAYHLFVEARIQVLLTLVIFIFTKDLALVLIIAFIHAVSRENPEPTGGGGIKQSSLWRVAYLSAWCFNKSSVPGGYRSVLLISLLQPQLTLVSWWLMADPKNLGDAELSLSSLEIAISSFLSCLPL